MDGGDKRAGEAKALPHVIKNEDSPKPISETVVRRGNNKN